MINVCFADNAPVIHRGILSYFEKSSSIKIKQNVDDYESLKRAIKSDSFDVLVLDVELNGFNSIREVKKLLQTNSKLKILFFSEVADTMYAAPALKVGAKGYVSKNVELETLEEAIVKVSKGEIYISEAVTRQLEILNKTKKEDRLFKKLSVRESEVLKYYNQGKKNKEVAKILGLDEKTISTYKLRLLQKLGVTNLLDLITKARDLGII
jgi:RNA polymerase sigma factor (sigma-70 family)